MNVNACDTPTPSQCVVEQRAFCLVRRSSQTLQQADDLQILYDCSQIIGFRFGLLDFLAAPLLSASLPFFQPLLRFGLLLQNFQIFPILKLDFPNDEADILSEGRLGEVLAVGVGVDVLIGGWGTSR